jgi:hypothetical protein
MEVFKLFSWYVVVFMLNVFMCLWGWREQCICICLWLDCIIVLYALSFNIHECSHCSELKMLVLLLGLCEKKEEARYIVLRSLPHTLLYRLWRILQWPQYPQTLIYYSNKYLCIDRWTVICSSAENCSYTRAMLECVHDQTVVSKALSFNVPRYVVNHFWKC